MSVTGKRLDKSSVSGEATDPLAGFKRRTYAVILAVGFTGSAFAWPANELAGSISLFTRLMFLTVLTVTALCIWGLRAGWLPVRYVEESVYLAISFVLLAVLFYALYFEPRPRLADVSLFSLHLWFPFIYIFVFLAYERAGALVRAGILYALSVLFSVPVLFFPAESRAPLEGINTLGLAYVSGAAIIVVLYFLTSMKDDLRKTELSAERMRHLAETDPLTGILNRRGLELELEREVERANRHGNPLCLILFDLDDFKLLNDTHGHDVGDEALIGVAREITPHLRDGDVFARWGGEEFSVLAPDTELEEACVLADRLCSIVAEIEGRTTAGWRISASFGTSVHRQHDSGTTLSKRADVALYRAKQLGKNRTEKST